MGQLTPLQQVQADAERLTLKRIADEKTLKAWQESQEGHISLGDEPEVAVEAEKPKTVTKKKGHK